MKNIKNKTIQNKAIACVDNLIIPAQKSAVDNESSLKESRKKGFTLIELIVVIAVLAILVSFAAASMVSVNRRKATRVGKLIDSELSTLASNTYSREGLWRLEISYDDDTERYSLTQQYNLKAVGSENWDKNWTDYSKTNLSDGVEISFGGSNFGDNESDFETPYYISISKENGRYLTDGVFNGYFCGNIFVHSAAKVVTISLSAESGGHRVID